MLENNLPSWRKDLKSSRRNEGESPSNRWVQIATVKDKNEPQVPSWISKKIMLI